MAQRFYLDSLQEDSGQFHFTLVFENPSDYFVERHHDTPQSFVPERLKNIPSHETGQHLVNGVPLNELVDAKLKEIGTA